MNADSSLLLPIRHAVQLLSSDAQESLRAFLKKQWTVDGGCRGRSAESDLYYTVFLLACHWGAQMETPPVVEKYLARFGDGEALDLVHLGCLARCHTFLKTGAARTALVNKLERFRCADGGYSQVGARGAIYESFLAWLIYQESGLEMPQREAFCRWLQSVNMSNGFADDSGLGVGTTTVTAAAVMLLKHHGMAIPAVVGDWILARHYPTGGFCVAVDTPAPDLLSTATALQALSAMSRSLGPERGACLEFVESLWAEEGGFCGGTDDPVADCEYTYYGLLALGHLLGG